MTSTSAATYPATPVRAYTSALSGAPILNKDGSFTLTINNKRYLVSSESPEARAKMEAVREKFHENANSLDFISCIENVAENIYQCKLSQNADQTSVIFCQKTDNTHVVKEITLNPETIAKTYAVAQHVFQPANQSTEDSSFPLTSSLKPRARMESGRVTDEIVIHPQDEKDLVAEKTSVSSALDKIMTAPPKKHLKFANDIKTLAKVKEIDLSNKKQVRALQNFYEKVQSIENQSDEQLIDLFSSKEFCKALDLCISHFGSLKNEKKLSVQAQKQSSEIENAFKEVHQKRKTFIQKCAKYISTPSTDIPKQFIKIVHMIFNEIDNVDFENRPMSKSEKISHLSNQITSLTKNLTKNLEGKELIGMMKHLYKIAQSCFKNEDYYIAMSITKGIGEIYEDLKDKKTKKEADGINVKALKLENAYREINERDLIKKSVLHPASFYNPIANSQISRIDIKKIEKPASFFSLKRKLTKIELESNRLNTLPNLTHAQLHASVKKEDFTINNFKEIETLKKFKFLQEHSPIRVASPTEIQAWRSFYTKMRVVKIAYEQDPLLVKELLENKDFIEISRLGIKKFESEKIFNSFGDEVEDYKLKKELIEIIQGYHTLEDLSGAVDNTFPFKHNNQTFHLYNQVKTDVLRTPVIIEDTQIDIMAVDGKLLTPAEVLNTLLTNIEQQGYNYPPEALAKILDILLSQTFTKPITEKLFAEHGLHGETTHPTLIFKSDTYTSLLSKQGNDIIFTKNFSFDEYDENMENVKSNVKVFFNIIIPQSKFIENLFPIPSTHDIKMTYLFEKTPTETETRSLADSISFISRLQADRIGSTKEQAPLKTNKLELSSASSALKSEEEQIQELEKNAITLYKEVEQLRAINTGNQQSFSFDEHVEVCQNHLDAFSQQLKPLYDKYHQHEEDYHERISPLHSTLEACGWTIRSETMKNKLNETEKTLELVKQDRRILSEPEQEYLQKNLEIVQTVLNSLGPYELARSEYENTINSYRKSYEKLSKALKK